MSYNNTKATNYLKAMKNTSINESYEDRSHWKSSWKADIAPHDKTTVRQFINNELFYYNNLIDCFNSRLRSQPESLISLVGKWEEIFGIIAETGFKIEKLRNAGENYELIPELEPYRDLLLGKDNQKKRMLTEKLIILLEIGSATGCILPRTRKNMALEILRFYKEQAKHSLQEVKGQGVLEGTTYKNNFSNLEKLDNTRKRHLQIAKEDLKYKYNPTDGKLRIWTRYTKEPIIIEGFSNVDEKPWNLLVIHQQPGEVVNISAPWMVEFKNVVSQYLFKLTELSNPYMAQRSWLAAKNNR